MSDNLLELVGLCKQYPKFALKDISFSIKPGRIIGFIGKNGAGKTTTLKSIMNLIKFDKGAVKVFGKDFTKNELELKQRMGFSLSELNYYPEAKIKNISKVIRRFYINFDDAKYENFLKVFNIDVNKKIKELSSGMKVKYLLSIALSQGSELLILDEPTSGLDPFSRDEVVEIFQDFVQDGKKSILFSTHITSDLEKCAQDIIYISEGEIRYIGSMQNLIDSYKIIEYENNIQEDKVKYIISTKTHNGAKKSLIKSKDLELFGDCIVEKASLEEIMIFLEKAIIDEKLVI